MIIRRKREVEEYEKWQLKERFLSCLKIFF